MRNNLFEAIVGALVLLCAFSFFIFSAKKAALSTSHGYKVIAQFDNADGLITGSEVKVSGVKVGEVSKEELDEKTYRAKLVVNIDSAVKLPKDSSAKIVSAGLLGQKYLAIEPGAEEEVLENGDEIKFTQSSINFEDLLGKFIFGQKKNE